MPLLRCFLGATLGYLLVSAIGPSTIHLLRRLCRERIDTASQHLAALHAKKAGTPSMGGLLIFGCWFAAVAVCCDFRHTNVLIAAGTVTAFAALGACDDLVKARRARRGLRARTKVVGQLAISLAAVMATQFADAQAQNFSLWYVPLACVFITGISNAVNVTDGLDGLAAGCGTLSAATLAAVALFLPVAASVEAARHEQLALMAAALAGTLAGFLRFNRSPARIFMGDAGSLPLGGLLGLLAFMLRCEWLLLVIGGVFVAELASVALQVVWFRRTGRRFFRCAPLHHHYEFRGWHERTIVRRFWAAAAGCALAGLVLLAFAPLPPQQLTAYIRTARPIHRPMENPTRKRGRGQNEVRVFDGFIPLRHRRACPGGALTGRLERTAAVPPFPHFVRRRRRRTKCEKRGMYDPAHLACQSSLDGGKPRRGGTKAASSRPRSGGQFRAGQGGHCPS